jgi:hypothetical protein
MMLPQGAVRTMGAVPTRLLLDYRCNVRRVVAAEEVETVSSQHVLGHSANMYSADAVRGTPDMTLGFRGRTACYSGTQPA